MKAQFVPRLSATLAMDRIKHPKIAQCVVRTLNKLARDHFEVFSESLALDPHAIAAVVERAKHSGDTLKELDSFLAKITKNSTFVAPCLQSI